MTLKTYLTSLMAWIGSLYFFSAVLKTAAALRKEVTAQPIAVAKRTPFGR